MARKHRRTRDAELRVANLLERSIAGQFGAFIAKRRARLITLLQAGDDEATNRYLARMRADWAAKAEAMGPELQRAARASQTIAARRLAAAAPKRLSIDPRKRDRGLGGVTKGFVERNVKLITRIGDDQVRRIKRDVVRAVHSGSGIKDLTKRIGAALSPGTNTEPTGYKSRARRIARDQVLTHNSQVERVQHANLGITEAYWRTIGGARVRPTHAANNGKKYKIGQGIGGIEPGDEVMCRCYAEPVFPD